MYTQSENTKSQVKLLKWVKIKITLENVAQLLFVVFSVLHV